MKDIEEVIKRKDFKDALDKLGLKLVEKDAVEEYEVIAEYEYLVGYPKTAQKVLTLSRERARDFEKLSREEQYEILEYKGELRIPKFEVEDVGELKNLYIREV